MTTPKTPEGWLTDAEQLARIAMLSEAACSLAWALDPEGEQAGTKARETRSRDAFDALMAHLRKAAPAAPSAEGVGSESKKFWLWKNFVDGKPEYWAFDNPYPINLTDGDPQTLGQPCGYALFKPSRDGSHGRTEEQVLREMASVRDSAAPIAPAGGEAPVAWYDPANKDPGQSVTFDKDKAANWPHLYRVPLYTHPSADLRGAAEQASREMKRYAPILERIADSPLWDDFAKGLGLATTNGYRAAIASLEAAISRKGKTE